MKTLLYYMVLVMIVGFVGCSEQPKTQPKLIGSNNEWERAQNSDKFYTCKYFYRKMNQHATDRVVDSSAKLLMDCVGKYEIDTTVKLTDHIFNCGYFLKMWGSPAKKQ